MNKTDLTEYSENELSLWVYNDEYLYSRRFTITENELAMYFIFTYDQWNTFQNDLNEELEND